MVIDQRHDHSIRVPRPDLSVKLGIPNACDNCHTHHSPKWAADQMKNLYGTQPKGYQTYAKILHAARAGMPAAEQLLAKLAANSSAPNIARATALSQLRRYLTPISMDIIQRSLVDNDPIIRAAAVHAVEAVEAVDPRRRLDLASGLLSDPILAVRIKAARVLAAVPQNQLNNEQGSALEKAMDEYIAAQSISADRPESHLNLGVLYTDNGQFKKAESAFRTALKLQPDFSLAHVNLADLYRIQGKDDIGERLLRDALQISPYNADVHHALGLLLVRRKRLNEAIVSFKKASMLKPSDPRYSYVHALALNTSGMRKEALKVLESTYKRHPNDLDILEALVALHRDGGNSEAARQYAEKLISLTLQGEAQ